MRTLFILIAVFLISIVEAQNEFIDDYGEATSDIQEMRFEDSSFRQDSIVKLLNLISDTKHRDLRGLVVIEKNKIVVEKYYNSFWRISVSDVRSAGKSITALLVGIAMKQGLIESLEQDVYSFFSKEKYPGLNEDYRKISLQNLLDMSSGLDADTNNTNSAGHAVNWMSKSDWKPYLFSVPMIGVPGEEWHYADIHALLLGAIIEEKSGMSLKDFAKEHLFEPLGIDQFYWYTNSSNQTGAAGNLYISTLDFAKLGLLVSNSGAWDGNQIIDSTFIDKLSNRALDISQEMGEGSYYGMLWYKITKTLEGQSFECVYAAGNGGNYLVVVPEKEIVIAISSGAYGTPYGGGRSYTIWNLILESLKN